MSEYLSTVPNAGLDDGYLSTDPNAGLEPPKKSSALRRIADVGVSLGKGVASIPELAVGLADIPTGGRVGKAVQDAGVDFKGIQRSISDLYSPEQQEANRKVQEAEGFGGTLKAAFQNPSTIVGAVAESAPLLIPGMGVARGLGGVTKLSGLARGAIGEGVTGAGLAAERTRQETDDGTLSAKQSLSAVGSGVGTALLGAAGGKVAQKLGISDIDTFLASKQVAPAIKQGFARRLAGGALAEGVFEELPQSVQEQVWQNYALGKPLDEGVAEAGAIGMIAGGAMGGAFSALNRGNVQPPSEAQPAQEQELQSVPTIAAGFSPDEVAAFKAEQAANQERMQRDLDIQRGMGEVNAGNDILPVEDVTLNQVDEPALYDVGYGEDLNAQAHPSEIARQQFINNLEPPSYLEWAQSVDLTDLIDSMPMKTSGQALTIQGILNGPFSTQVKEQAAARLWSLGQEARIPTPESLPANAGPLAKAAAAGTTTGAVQLNNWGMAVTASVAGEPIQAGEKSNFSNTLKGLQNAQGQRSVAEQIQESDKIGRDNQAGSGSVVSGRMGQPGQPSTAAPERSERQAIPMGDTAHADVQRVETQVTPLLASEPAPVAKAVPASLPVESAAKAPTPSPMADEQSRPAPSQRSKSAQPNNVGIPLTEAAKEELTGEAKALVVAAVSYGQDNANAAFSRLRKQNMWHQHEADFVASEFRRIIDERNGLKQTGANLATKPTQLPTQAGQAQGTEGKTVEVSPPATTKPDEVSAFDQRYPTIAAAEQAIKAKKLKQVAVFKDGDQYRIGARGDKKQAPSTNLIQRIKQLGGIHTRYRADVIGDKAGAPGLFSNTGKGLDDLATALQAEGFAIDTAEAGGGVDALTGLIQRAVNSGETVLNYAGQQAAAEKKIADDFRDNLKEEIAKLGGNPARNASTQKLVEMLNSLRAQLRADLEQESIAKAAQLEAIIGKELTGAEWDMLLDERNAQAFDYTQDIAAIARMEQEREAANAVEREYEGEGAQAAGQRAGEGPRQGDSTGGGEPQAARTEAGQEAFGLTGETPEEIRTREEAQAAKAKSEQDAADKADAEAKKARIDAEVANRQQASAENFTLGQSAEDALAGQGDIFGQETKPDRYEIGRSLTKEQRRKAISTLVDVYKLKNAEKEERIDARGESYFAYPYQPDYFEKSDITGAMLRYYVTLPDGKIAHPSELFPDFTEADIAKEMARQRDEERAADNATKARRDTLERRMAESIHEANVLFWKSQVGTGIKPEETALLTNGTKYARTLKDNAENDVEVLGDGWKPATSTETPAGQPAAQEKPVSFLTFKQWVEQVWGLSRYKDSYLENNDGNERLAKLSAATGGAADAKVARAKYFAELMALPRDTAISLDVFDALNDAEQRDAQRHFFDLDWRLTDRLVAEGKARVEKVKEQSKPYEDALASVNSEIKRLDEAPKPDTKKVYELRQRADRLAEALRQINNGKEPDGRLLKPATETQKQPATSTETPAGQPAANTSTPAQKAPDSSETPSDQLAAKSITRNGDNIVVIGYPREALENARTKLHANAIIDKKGQAVFRAGTDYTALQEALNPGSAYIPDAKSLKAADFPMYVSGGKFSNARAHNFAKKFGAKSFDNKPEAEAYAEALTRGEGGNWKAKKHLGKWRAVKEGVQDAQDQTKAQVPQAQANPTPPVQIQPVVETPVDAPDGIQAEGDAGVSTADVGKAKQPTTPIVDIGEKIGGARKDIWTSYKDKLAEANEVDIKAEPLSKSWPAPDYDAMLEDGANQWAVAFMHAARDEIPTKPSSTWKLGRWVEQVKMLREFAIGLTDGTVSVESARREIAKTQALSDIASRIDLYMAVGHSKSLRGISMTAHSYSLYRGTEYKPAKVLWAVEQKAKATAFSNWPRELAIGETKEEALAIFKKKYAELDIDKPASKETKFEIYSTRGENGYRIGKKIGRNPILLTESFATVKEAREHMREHQDELVKKLEDAKKIPSVRRDSNEPRVGEDMRDGQDVTPQMFMDAFGFKGVEFGNWVEQKTRQKDLNDAYDALMDMAAVIGVKPNALSLNGELGLAFGARGKGGIDPAKAHYEADFIVINLTKKNGAGSLGHEWWHALDNYFERMRGKKGGYATEAMDVSLARRGSTFISNTAVRKEMVEAFGGVMRAIHSTTLKARSAKLDAKRVKDYWTTGLEMSARAYESYLISKLQDQDASNDYLANIVDEKTWAAAEKMGFELDGSYPYPTAGEVPAIRAAFDHFFQTIESKETDKGIALFSRRPSFFSPLAKAIQTAKQDTMPAPQWRLWLNGNKAKLGLKDDEIQFSGINEYLELRGKDKVTKAEIADYLRGIGGKVVSVDTEGGKQPGFSITQEVRENLTEQGLPLFARTNDATQSVPYTYTKASPEDQAAIDKLNSTLQRYFGNDKHGLVPFSGRDTDVSRAFSEEIRSLFKTRVIFVQPKSGSGLFNGFQISGLDAIFVDGTSDAGFIQIAGHELWHHIETTRPDLAKWYGEQAKLYIKDLPAYRNRLNSLLQQGEEAYTDAGAESELLADFLGDSLSDPDFLQRLASSNESKFKRLITTVRMWLGNLAYKMRGLKSSRHIGDVRALQTYLAKVLDAYTAGKNIGGIATPNFQRVWHGTPHIWAPEPGFPHGRPRLDKMGTGEGNQAYGFGWYSAESQGVAETYKDLDNVGRPGDVLFDGVQAYKLNWLVDNTPEEYALRAVGTLQSVQKAERDLKKLAGYGDDDYVKAYEWFLKNKDRISWEPIEVRYRGSLYQLDIPDATLPYLLDWDRPLSQQTPEVRKALEFDIERRGLGQTDDGKFIYKQMGRDDKSRSEYLASIGIVGNRYLDGQSRNRPLKDIKREFLAELPEDADASEVAELIGTGKFSPKNDALLRALKNDDWLGFDYPAQAVSAALSKDQSGYDASPELIHAVAEAKEGGTYNFVIWDQPTLDRIALLERNGEKLDAMREADVRMSRTGDTIPMPDVPKKMSQKAFESLIQDFDTGGYAFTEEDERQYFRDVFAPAIKRMKAAGVTHLDMYHVTDAAIDDFRHDGVIGSEVDYVGRAGGNTRAKSVYGFLDPDDIAKGFDGILGSTSDRPNVLHIKVPLDSIAGFKWDSNFNVTYGTYSGIRFVGDIPFDWVSGAYSYNPTNPDIRFSRSGQSSGRTQADPIWSAEPISKMDTFLYELQDKHIDTKRIIQAIQKQGKQISDEWNVYIKEALYHGRTAKKTEDFLTDEVKPAIELMAKHGISQEDMDEYLHARHAIERNRVMKERNPDREDNDGLSGMTDEDAKAILAKAKPGFKEAAKVIDSIIAKTRQELVGYGLEKQETVDSWAELYSNYVPLQREGFEDRPGTGMGFSVRGNSSKEATGSHRAVENILAHVAMQREKAIVRGEKNRVATALYGLAQQFPNSAFWKLDKPAQMTQINPDTGQVEVVAGDLADYKVPRVKYIGKDGTVKERIDPNYKGRNNVMTVRINGVDHAIIFNDQDARAMRMVEALKNIDADQLGEIVGGIGQVTRYIASMATQYNPVFGVINLIRDTQTAALNLSSTELKGKQGQVMKASMVALKGIYQDARAVRDGKHPSSPYAKLWEEFQATGGQTGYRDMFRTSNDRAEAIEKMLDPEWWQKGKFGKAITLNGILAKPEQLLFDKVGRKAFNWLSDYNLAMENAMRLGAYKVARDNGMSKDKSAFLAKNLTVNFNKKGKAATQAGALYAFFNASAQGTARIAETLHAGAKDGEFLGKTGKAIVYGGITLGAMNAIALIMAGFDDDEPPEFMRERNLIIPAPGTDKGYVSIPMPLGFHVLPNIGRVLVESAVYGKPMDRMTDLLMTMLESFNPIGTGASLAQTISPTVFDPVIAMAENKDWTGKNIYREDFNKTNPTPGFTRTKDSASAFSKGIAEAINTITGGTEFQPGRFSPTPDQIDYLIGQVTGGVGREITKVMASADSAVTGEELPMYKVPIAGRLVGTSSDNAAVRDRFYDNVRMLNMHEAEIKGRREKQEPTLDYIREHPETRYIRMATATETQVRNLQKRKRQMIEDGKRESVKLIDAQIAAKMKRLNDMVSNAKT